MALPVYPEGGGEGLVLRDGNITIWEKNVRTRSWILGYRRALGMSYLGGDKKDLSRQGEREVEQRSIGEEEKKDNCIIGKKTTLNRHFACVGWRNACQSD